MEGVDTFNVINGADLVRRFRNEIEYLDFARLLEPASKIEKSDGRFLVTTSSGTCLEARAVILATGADAVRLDVPGADKFWLKGVAYSTVSYAPLYIDKTVALIGSGWMAMRGAAELAQIAKQLYLVAPTHGELDTPMGRRVAGAPHVELLENWEAVAVEGDVYARRLVVRAPDGYERSLDVDGIFVELGLKPHSELVQGLTAVDESRPRARQLRHGDDDARPVRGRRRDPAARRAGGRRDRRGREGSAGRVRILDKKHVTHYTI